MVTLAIADKHTSCDGAVPVTLSPSETQLYCLQRIDMRTDESSNQATLHNVVSIMQD